MTPALDILVAQVQAAAQNKTPLRIRAGGSKDFYGNHCVGQILDPRAHRGIVSYEPSELVITARCGTSLAELQRTLAEQRQMLGFEPPHFGAQASVGGMVAAGLSGPRRAATPGGGSVRDFVLGAQLLNGRGEVLTFGGQVMKNVAGYDVARLLAGSLGTLGLILEVSLKVVPRPEIELTLHFALSEMRAIRTLNQWAAQPWPISATLWHQGVLHVRLSGTAAAVDVARTALGGETLTEAEAGSLWAEVREHRHTFFLDDATSGSRRSVWRLSMPSITPSLDLGPTLIEWNGALRWIRSDMPAEKLRTRVTAAGGHATLFRSHAPHHNAFHPLDPVVAKLHQRLKAEFDPQHIFNPGRMYAHF